MENVNTNEVLCKIIKDNDSYFIVDCNTGEMSNPLVISKDGIAFILPANAANRKFANVKNVNAAIDANGEYPLTYKATRTIGNTGGTKMPNAKLISYLSPEEQEEYKAIIARAIEAKQAAENKPKTEADKLQDKIAKAQKALEKLMAQAASMDDTITE